MLCDHPKNMLCCKCTCLYWIKRSKLQVPFWFLCLSTGLRYVCSFCCYDSAGSKDPPDRYSYCRMLSGWKTDISAAKASLLPPNPPCETCLPRKAQVLLVSPALPGVFEWQLRLAGTLAPHYCSRASKSVISFLWCQPGSESSICLQLHQIWDSSCFRNKLCLLFG